MDEIAGTGLAICIILLAALLVVVGVPVSKNAAGVNAWSWLWAFDDGFKTLKSTQLMTTVVLLIFCFVLSAIWIFMTMAMQLQMDTDAVSISETTCTKFYEFDTLRYAFFKKVDGYSQSMRNGFIMILITVCILISYSGCMVLYGFIGSIEEGGGILKYNSANKVRLVSGVIGFLTLFIGMVLLTLNMYSITGTTDITTSLIPYTQSATQKLIDQYNSTDPNLKGIDQYPYLKEGYAGQMRFWIIGLMLVFIAVVITVCVKYFSEEKPQDIYSFVACVSLVVLTTVICILIGAFNLLPMQMANWKNLYTHWTGGWKDVIRDLLKHEKFKTSISQYLQVSKDTNKAYADSSEPDYVFIKQGDDTVPGIDSQLSWIQNTQQMNTGTHKLVKTIIDTIYWITALIMCPLIYMILHVCYKTIPNFIVGSIVIVFGIIALSAYLLWMSGQLVLVQ